MGIYVSIACLNSHITVVLIWYRNAKPSDSDLEDEDEDEEDVEDPSTWMWEDDQDDGIKGQNIVQPDSIDDLSNVIRIDGSKTLQYSTFYEPRDND